MMTSICRTSAALGVLMAVSGGSVMAQPDQPKVRGDLWHQMRRPFALAKLQQALARHRPELAAGTLVDAPAICSRRGDAGEFVAIKE